MALDRERIINAIDVKEELKEQRRKILEIEDKASVIRSLIANKLLEIDRKYLVGRMVEGGSGGVEVKNRFEDEIKLAKEMSLKIQNPSKLVAVKVINKSDCRKKFGEDLDFLLAEIRNNEKFGVAGCGILLNKLIKNYDFDVVDLAVEKNNVKKIYDIFAALKEKIEKINDFNSIDLANFVKTIAQFRIKPDIEFCKVVFKKIDETILESNSPKFIAFLLCGFTFWGELMNEEKIKKLAENIENNTQKWGVAELSDVFFGMRLVKEDETAIKIVEAVAKKILNAGEMSWKAIRDIILYWPNFNEKIIGEEILKYIIEKGKRRSDPPSIKSVGMILRGLQNFKSKTANAV